MTGFATAVCLLGMDEGEMFLDFYSVLEEKMKYFLQWKGVEYDE
jgi:hypothetical protein